MDQEFAFLIKRWSDDYESSQKLRQELASLKQQYDCLLGQFQSLQREREHELRARSNSNQDPYQNRSGTNARQPDCESMKQMLDSSAAEIQYLKSENNNLHQALRRHEQQAAGSSQSITKFSEDLQRLTLENAKLSEQRDCLSQQCERMGHKLENLQLNVKVAHETNKKLEEQATEAIQRVEILRDELAHVASAADKIGDVEAIQKRTIMSYETQIQEMTRSLGVKEAEKKALTDELTNCRDTLQKLRDANRSLTSTVGNLQGMILHKLNGAHTTSHDVGQAQPSTTHQSRLQPSSNTTTTDKLQSNKAESQSVDQKQNNTLRCQDLQSLKASNDKAVMQVASQSALNTTTMSMRSADLSPMPLERRQAFVGMRNIIPNIADTGEKFFERSFLKSSIGGATQALIVRVTDSQTPLAKSREITSYLCPGLDHNPWCPAAPGQHGYMFVGLGREKDTFLEPEDFNVFVGLLKSKNSERRKYRYIGVYRAVRVSPLAVDEWHTLSEPVKGTYVSRTKEKTVDPRGLAQIRAAYDQGELSVPCVMLECVAFDDVLFSSLVEAIAKPSGDERLPSSAKRRRVASNADSVHTSYRKKVTLIV